MLHAPSEIICTGCDVVTCLTYIADAPKIRTKVKAAFLKTVAEMDTLMTAHNAVLRFVHDPSASAESNATYERELLHRESWGNLPWEHPIPNAPDQTVFSCLSYQATADLLERWLRIERTKVGIQHIEGDCDSVLEFSELRLNKLEGMLRNPHESAFPADDSGAYAGHYVMREPSLPIDQDPCSGCALCRGVTIRVCSEIGVVQDLRKRILRVRAEMLGHRGSTPNTDAASPAPDGPVHSDDPNDDTITDEDDDIDDDDDAV